MVIDSKMKWWLSLEYNRRREVQSKGRSSIFISFVKTSEYFPFVKESLHLLELLCRPGLTNDGGKMVPGWYNERMAEMISTTPLTLVCICSHRVDYFSNHSSSKNSHTSVNTKPLKKARWSKNAMLCRQFKQDFLFGRTLSFSIAMNT